MPYLGKSPSAGVRQRYQYTATAGQTTFSGTDTANLTLTYTDNNFVDVFQNGVLLKGGTTDYTATSGTSVVLTTGASVSDVIEIIVYDVFSVGNFYNRTDSDSRFVNHDSGTLGTDNFIAGNNAGDAITSGGNYNTLVGNEAGTALTTGDNNVAVGFEALTTEDADGGNTAVGYRALKTLNAGAEGFNTAVGKDAGLSSTTGVANTLIGALAGDALTTGNNNVAIGHEALGAEIQGDQNVAVGVGALQAQSNSSDTDVFNTAVGYNAGLSVTTGKHNTLIGARSGDALTEGQYNVSIGDQSLSADTKGSRSVAVGYGALNPQNHTSATDAYNVGIGYTAGNALSTGVNNVLVGGLAGDAITTGDHNIAIGKDAIHANTAGNKSIGIGSSALYSQNITSDSDGYNVAVGFNAGYNLSTGTENTLLGSQVASGDTITGANNTCVGFQAGHGLTSGGNNLFLGHDAGRAASPAGNQTTGSNTICLGDDNIGDFFCADTSISSSDSRDKADITDFNIGLNWVKDLRPITYKWDKRSWYGTEEEPLGTPDGSKKSSKVHIGFVAQEVLEIEKANGFADSKDTMLTCNLTEDGQRYGMKYERLVPVLVNAIKELSTKNDALETENTTQKTQIADLISRVTALEGG